MATAVPPKKNTAYVFYSGLISQSDTKLLKASATLAAGDAKVSIDGGAFANLATLPAVTPAAGTAVKISLSAAEMNGDNIVVTLIDAAGAEWCDQLIELQTVSRQVDDLAFPTTSGRSLDVSAGGEAGLDWANIGSPTTANNLSATNIDVDQIVASVSGAVGSVTGLTASNLDATVSSRMATYTQPTGFLTATFPAGTVANTTNITAGTITTATNLTNAPTAGDLTATMKTSVTTAATAATPIAASVTGAVGSVSTGGIAAASFAAGAIDAAAIAANAIGASELAADAATEIADAILTRQITEAYAANGVAPTTAQAIMAIHQMLMQFGIASTALTVKKLDNATTAFVVTLDDATSPTAATRT